ncbi:MAG: MFS transporter family glucose-6-phosphate receptor UhpC [Simkaniaceae bacterium]|nr:MFS transporter family glucose-6-phosphate receptor UhpC [Simkaniaceae bacterium]
MIFRSFLKIFSPAPHAEMIEDPKAMKSTYTYWRWRILIGMYVGYALFYLTRKSFIFVMPAMVSELGMTKAQLGILGSVLYISYGLSKFLSGILADRSNPRYFMAIGLIATGLFNICFGYSSAMLLFALFWGMNGLFQGWGWPPCARLLTHWYEQSERGRWWGVWNTSHNVGGALIPLIAAFCASAYGWRVAMYVPGVICIMGGFFLIWCLRDTPESLGLPPVEQYHKVKDKATITGIQKDQELTTKEILFEYVLKNRFVWMLAIAYFFVYVVRIAINDWGQMFLIEGKSQSYISAGSSLMWFEVGGFFGSLVAGWSSDKIFGGRRAPVNVIFCIGVLISLYALYHAPQNSWLFSSISMGMIGFLIFGPQMLIGMAAAELSHKKAAATATGFAGWFGYFGAASAAYPIGQITENYGWQGFFTAMGVCAVVSVVLLLPMWSVKTFAEEEPA